MGVGGLSLLPRCALGREVGHQQKPNATEQGHNKAATTEGLGWGGLAGFRCRKGRSKGNTGPRGWHGRRTNGGPEQTGEEGKKPAVEARGGAQRSCSGLCPEGPRKPGVSTEAQSGQVLGGCVGAAEAKAKGRCERQAGAGHGALGGRAVCRPPQFP